MKKRYGGDIWARGYLVSQRGADEGSDQEYLKHHFERDLNDGFDVESNRRCGQKLDLQSAVVNRLLYLVIC